MITKKQYLAFLIGNDTTIFDLIKLKLEKIAYIKVVSFNNVYRALEFSTENPDFIIFDDTIGTNEGLTSVPFFKEHSPQAKIIALSNQQDINLFEKALNLGVDQYYSKNITDFILLENYITTILSTSKTKWLREKIKSLKPKLIKKEKIIYILDDSSLTSFTIDNNLSKNSSYYVQQFNTIRKFQDGFAEKKPDIVVLDYYLNEELNGLDILKQIKQESPNTIVIMMSTQQDVRTASELLAHGANHYFIKTKKNIEQLTNYIEQLEITQQKNLSLAG